MIPKLIMQGDLRQIQPVGSGSGMALVANESGDVKLTEIRRQRGASDEETQARRALAALFYEQKTDAQGNVVGITDDRHVKSRAEQQAKGARITKALHRHGMLEERSTRAEAKEALLDDWSASEKPLSEKLMLAHTNADVASLNGAARGYLKSNGQLAEKDHSIRVKTGTGKTARFAVMPFAEGESIKFRAKNARMGVVNNSTGTIERINEARDGSFDLTVRINALNGSDRRVTFNTSKDYNAIASAYCRTIHDAQGQGASQIFHLAHAGMLDNQAALVAFTRLTTGSYTMYGDSTTMEMLEGRLGVDRLKETAVLTKGGVQAPHSTRPQGQHASARLMQAFDGVPVKEPPVQQQKPMQQRRQVRRQVQGHSQSL
jgi:ATP-dependent exoDNAse (exonuclease V) alpha subunit